MPQSKWKLLKGWRRYSGAAFLMATAAIGPGFITQTTVFTGQLFTSFGFAILVSVIIDILVQLNIWTIIGASGLRAPVLANKALPGTGYLLVVLVAGGGFIFNIGNIGGCSMALAVLADTGEQTGVLVSAAIAILVFVVKEFGKAMDAFAKLLGLVMIGLMMFIAWKAYPPWPQMALHTFMPEKIDIPATLTLVGGTVGGYISFAGAHRMLDAGYNGPEHIRTISSGAVSGIILAALMRFLLFAAVAGVVATGFILPDHNPAAAVFGVAAGNAGRILFGIILWAAAITSVVASAYTSISFLAAVFPPVARHQAVAIIVFIILAALVFAGLGNPTRLLVRAGTINGLVLPIALALMLLAANRLQGNGWQLPSWLKWSGWAAVLVLLAMAMRTILLL